MLIKVNQGNLHDIRLGPFKNLYVDLMFAVDIFIRGGHFQQQISRGPSRFYIWARGQGLFACHEQAACK